MTTKPLTTLTNADMGRTITLPDGTSGVLAGSYWLDDAVVLSLITDGVHRWVGPLAGDLDVEITKEGG